MISKIKGKARFIIDSKGKVIDNIDTDQIFHNRHLAITDIEKMGEFAFGNLKGWESFPTEAQPGDLVIAGENFGSGSSRQQAVDCFRSLGIVAIIAKSFGSIYKRNAVNSGFLVLVCEDIDSILVNNEEYLSKKLILKVDLDSGIIKDAESNEQLGMIKPLSRVEREIYTAGGIFEYGKRLTG